MVLIRISNGKFTQELLELSSYSSRTAITVVIQIFLQLSGLAFPAFAMVHEAHSKDAGATRHRTDFHDVVDKLSQGFLPRAIFLIDHGVGDLDLAVHPSD